jgi:hypothetical protein
MKAIDKKWTFTDTYIQYTATCMNWKLKLKQKILQAELFFSLC